MTFAHVVIAVTGGILAGLAIAFVYAWLWIARVLRHGNR